MFTGGSFNYVELNEVNFRFANMVGVHSCHLNKIKGDVDLTCAQMNFGSLMPVKLAKIFNDNINLDVFSIISQDNLSPLTGNGFLFALIKYGLQNQLFTFDEIETWFIYESDEVKTKFLEKLAHLKQYEQVDES